MLPWFSQEVTTITSICSSRYFLIFLFTRAWKDKSAANPSLAAKMLSETNKDSVPFGTRFQTANTDDRTWELD